MAVFVTDYFYLLRQNGPNGKVVEELFPNSQATSTEGNPDSVLMPGETFTSAFTLSPDLQTQFPNPEFTYAGQDPSVPGAIAQGPDGEFYLFSNTPDLVGENLNGIDPDATFPVCFLAGTMIRCPEGERAVETLAIGDLILTMNGRTVPVKWIGRQTVVALFGLPEGRRPVCIAAGALGENLPNRDLRLTSDHALLIDDVLVHAGALVNGSTIRRIPNAELGRFTVFHIETENHEVILAEGTPAETFVDNVSRRRFDNYAEYAALYGNEDGANEELPQPRAMSSRQVPLAIRSAIAQRAGALVTRLPDAA